MAEGYTFLAKARTVDHLGREQIADCPTAISELWKNAFDAYSKTSELHIFDGDTPVAAMVDDGHGMNYEEFTNKWLVIGTESKKEKIETPKSDMMGLRPRPKQGQKGIGRLSSAIMGPLLLIISKRQNEDYVAALIDWRLFENPYFFLQDIRIPVERFSVKEELFDLLPSMTKILLGNLEGNDLNQDRELRIKSAWDKLGLLEKEKNTELTKNIILDALNKQPFKVQHFEQWPVWNGSSESGTAMFISDIHDDLQAQLSNVDTDSPSTQAKNKFKSTLSSFCENLVGFSENIFDVDSSDKIEPLDFTCQVLTWKNGLVHKYISSGKEFGSSSFHILEHVLSGKVDESGTFSGRMKAFGRDLGYIEVKPPYALSKHPKSKVGEFHLTVGSYEVEAKNTTLSPELFQTISDHSLEHSGFLVYRDGLRVMPYGREDNDFFEIEVRRSKNAGTYHYSNRNIFGRVALSSEYNYNLRDKAGREGLIDNKAAKEFRDLVINILITVSRRYIGRTSGLRHEILPNLNKEYKRKRAEEQREKKRKQGRRKFSSNLKKFSPLVDNIVNDINECSKLLENGYSNISLEDVIRIRDNILVLKERVQDTKISDVPDKLGAIEKKYRIYRDQHQFAAKTVNEIQATTSLLIERLQPKLPAQVAEETLKKHISVLKRRTNQHLKNIKEIFDVELEMLSEQSLTNIVDMEFALSPLIDDVARNSVPLSKAIQEFSIESEGVEDKNLSLFNPYFDALESLKNKIDVDALASFNTSEFDEMRDEIVRLNGLAQLGIAVEIIGHELDSLDTTVLSNLDKLPLDIKSTEQYQRTISSYKSLSERLKFLSPLKLSGSRSVRWINGFEIEDYINKFFEDILNRSNVSFRVSDKFRSLMIYDDPSKIFPVFINLINNSRYWVCQTNNQERIILIDIYNSEVVVSDNGPGVDREDIDNLFQLFFTKKMTGGRGVGLYLCRSNLASSGHKIRYLEDKKSDLLQGANFAIEFKGAKFE